MKNLTKLILTIILYSFLCNVSANDLSYKITTKKSTVLIDFMNSSGAQEEVTIQITNDDGEVYLEKQIQVSSKMKEEFNVSSLEKGEYVFKMKFENKILTKDFKLSSSKRISMRGYSMRTKDRSFIVSLSGQVMKIETNDYMKGNLQLKFKTSNGSEEIYQASFSPGENNIASIDLRTLGVSQFVLDLSSSNATYTDTFTMF